MDLQALYLLLNPALTLGFVFSWTGTPLATGAKGTWLQELSGSPEPQLPPQESSQPCPLQESSPPERTVSFSVWCKTAA